MHGIGGTSVHVPGIRHGVSKKNGSPSEAVSQRTQPRNDGLDAWRCEAALVRAGHSRADVRTWSIPRIRIWLAIIEEAEWNSHLRQSLAVWDPKKAQESRDRSARLMHGGEGNDQWEPPSVERVMKRMAEQNKS